MVNIEIDTFLTFLVSTISTQDVGKGILLFYQTVTSGGVIEFALVDSSTQKMATFEQTLNIDMNIDSFTCQSGKNDLLIDCILFEKNNQIKHIEIEVSQTIDKFSISQNTSYKYYQQFVYDFDRLAFDNDILIVKATRKIFTEDENPFMIKNEEVALLYSKSFRSGTQNSFLAYGLKSKEYYGSELLSDPENPQGIPLLLRGQDNHTRVLAFS
jgi:hypothetical protein